MAMTEMKTFGESLEEPTDRLWLEAVERGGENAAEVFLILASLERSIRDSIDPSTPLIELQTRIQAFQTTAERSIQFLLEHATA